MTKKNWKAVFVAAASSFLGKELVQQLDAKGVLDKLEEFSLLPKQIPGGARGLNVIVAALKELGVEQIPNKNVRAFLDSVIEEGERRYRPVAKIFSRKEQLVSRRTETAVPGTISDTEAEFIEQAFFMNPEVMATAREYIHEDQDPGLFRERLNQVVSSLLTDHYHGMKPGSSLKNLVSNGFDRPFTWQENMVCFHIDELVEMIIQATLDWTERVVEFVGRTYGYGLFHLMETMESDTSAKMDWKLALDKLRRASFPRADRSKIRITEEHEEEIRTDLVEAISDWMSGDFIVLPASDGQEILFNALETCGPDESEQQRMVIRTMLKMHDKFVERLGGQKDQRDIEERIEEAMQQAESMDSETRSAFEKVAQYVDAQAGKDMQK